MAKALSLVVHNDLDSQVEALERDGYVYFPGVLDADEIAELRATMDRLEAIPESHDRDETPENGNAFLHKLISNSLIETRCISNSLTDLRSLKSPRRHTVRISIASVCIRG